MSTDLRYRQQARDRPTTSQVQGSIPDFGSCNSLRLLQQRQPPQFIKMVRIDLGGLSLLDVDSKSGGIGEAKKQLRQRMRGSGTSTRTVHLNWNTTTPRIVLTSDTDEFDPTIISHFQEEGFQISYLEYDGNHSEYLAKLQHLQDPLEPLEKYAIVGE